MSHSFGRLGQLLQRKRILARKDKRRLWNHLGERTEAVQGAGPPSRSDVLNHLLKAGTDYAGQVNYAFQTAGVQGLFGARIDALRLGLTAAGLPFLPLTGALRPELTLTGARHRLVLVAYQSDQTPGHPNPTPLLLSEMQGVTGQVRLHLGVEVGPSWNPTRDVPGLEEAGIRFSVRATVGGSGACEGSYLRVWDGRPRYYARAERSGRLANDATLVLAGSATTSAPTPFNPLASYTVWTQTGEGVVSADAELRAKVGFGQTVGAELKPAVKGPRLQRAWSWSSARLQTMAANGIVMTQDSERTYKKTSGQLLQVDAELRATAGAAPAYASKPKKDLFGLKKKTEHAFVNAMAYRAGVIFWCRGDRRLRVLSGSGLQVGHSVTLPALAALFGSDLEDQRKHDFIVTLAAALQVDGAQLWMFLCEAQDLIESLVLDPGVKPGALLVEAAFRPAHAGFHRLSHTLVEGAQPPPFLDALGGDGMSLETLRLRYRMRDAESKDRTLFKLGVYPYAAEVYTQIDKIEQYGSEGIVDLHVTAFAPRTVQPAILIG